MKKFDFTGFCSLVSTLKPPTQKWAAIYFHNIYNNIPSEPAPPPNDPNVYKVYRYVSMMLAN